VSLTIKILNIATLSKKNPRSNDKKSIHKRGRGTQI